MKYRALDLLPARITSRLMPSDECWSWRGWHNGGGYGYVRWDGRDQPTHRVIYELIHGEQPGLDVDHLCKNPSCCNPEHMEAVPHRVNIKRGRAGTKMACNYGHDWHDPRNVYVRKDGRRWCAACARERW